MPPEWVTLDRALGRVLAADVHGPARPAARRRLRHGRLRRPRRRYGDRRPVARGRRRAHRPAIPSPATVGAGETVRIFTGGAAAGRRRRHRDPGERRGRRRRGRFSRQRPTPGEFVRAGRARLRGRATRSRAPARGWTRATLGLAAAMGHAWLPVRRRPRVAHPRHRRRARAAGRDAGTGPDRQLELDCPRRLRPALGRRADRPRHRRPTSRPRCAARIEAVDGLTLLVTTGGASVGDHDLVQSALGERGLELDFWKIAMRPGKPLMFGRLGTDAACSACPAIRSRRRSAPSCSCAAASCAMLGLDPRPARAPRPASPALSGQRPPRGLSPRPLRRHQRRHASGRDGVPPGQLDVRDLRPGRRPRHPPAPRPAARRRRPGRDRRPPHGPAAALLAAAAALRAERPRV